MNIKSLILALAIGLVAVQARAMTAADVREIQHYVLTDDFLKRYAGVIKESDKMSGKSHDMDDADDATIDSMAAEISRMPGAGAILARHGLSARQLLVGSMALMTTMSFEILSADPHYAAVLDPQMRPSAANIAFYRSHRAQIDAIVDHPK